MFIVHARGKILKSTRDGILPVLNSVPSSRVVSVGFFLYKYTASADGNAKIVFAVNFQPTKRVLRPVKNHTRFKSISLHEFGSLLPSKMRAARETFRPSAVPVSERFCPDR